MTGTPEDLLRRPPTATSMLRQALRRYPSRVAFRGAGEEVTYAAAADLLGRFQAVLAARGVRPGDVVGLLAKNRWQAWLASAAVASLGAVECWLHPLGTLEGHVDQLAQAHVRLLIIDQPGFPDRADAFKAARPDLQVLTLGGAGEADLRRAAEAVGTSPIHDHSDVTRLGALSFTGGTTGKPKAVERTAASLAHLAITTLAAFELPARPNYLAVGPISHVAGTKILPTLMRGGTVSFMARFDPAELLQTIERERINFTLAVPTMIYDLLDSPEMGRRDLSSLELLLYGASAMSPTRLAEGLERIGPVFSQLYGQSECYPIAVLAKADHIVARPDLLAACGHPVPGCEVRLLADDLSEAPPGGVGEICVRGAGVMKGYLNNPGMTAETLAGGWLHTGDLARFDDEGRLHIVDRKKDMIVSGGFNVFPREIEDVLTSHPAVAAAAVIGVPDPRWGEAVHAVVTVRPGHDIDETALRDLVRAAKGALLTPKSVEIVDTLPLTATGKVDKKILREKYWGGQDRRVG